MLVAPVWKSQPWYPLLLHLCIASPILLPQYPGLLSRQGETHPLTNLQLAGWLLSANPYSEAGISERAQTLLVAAWRKGTTSAYSSAWGKWNSWCSKRKINPVLMSINPVLESNNINLDALQPDKSELQFILNQICENMAKLWSVGCPEESNAIQDNVNNITGTVTIK